MRAELAAGVIAFKALIAETGSVSGPLEVLGSLVPPSKLREPGDSDIREDDDGEIRKLGRKVRGRTDRRGRLCTSVLGQAGPGSQVPTEPGAVLTAGAGGLSAMAATAKE